jgi:hypothetical protein
MLTYTLTNNVPENLLLVAVDPPLGPSPPSRMLKLRPGSGHLKKVHPLNSQCGGPRFSALFHIPSSGFEESRMYSYQCLGMWKHHCYFVGNIVIPSLKIYMIFLHVFL